MCWLNNLYIIFFNDVTAEAVAQVFCKKGVLRNFEIFSAWNFIKK